MPVIFLKNHMAFMYSRDLRTWLKLDDLNMNIGCFYETAGMNGSSSTNGTEIIALKNQQADEFNVFFDNLLSKSENSSDTVSAGIFCENDASSSVL